MLFIYQKSDQVDLTDKQKKMLIDLVMEKYPDERNNV